MANTKISQLPAVTTVTGTDVVPVVQDGVTKSATASQLLASVLGANPPAALDTLRELADAIGDDPTYAADLATTVAGKTPAMTVAGVKTAAYTAAAYEIVPVDATGGTVPISLPAAPADKTRVTVKKIDASTNTVTVTTGGTDVLNKAGGSTTATLALPNQSTTVQYTAGTGIWYVIAADMPLSQLDGRYWRTFTVPAPTGNAATDTANITAAANAAYTAGGGRVVLQTCPYTAGTLTPYRLNAGLPVLPGIAYEGVEPVPVPTIVTNGTWLPDGDWNYRGGTVLVGDGTFAAFEANATDAGAVDANVGNFQIASFGLTNIGLDNFTYGIHVGAVNVPGLVWGRIDKVFIKNCSQWGVYLANFQHLQVGEIRTCLCQNGQYYGALFPATTLMPGNAEFGEIFNMVPRDGRDNRQCRGIVFEAGGTAAKLNEMVLRRVQCNGFGRTLLSVTATITSATTGVTVPDGTKFAAGMPVVFTTTNFGYTTGLAYIVLTVTGNTLTLGTQRTGTAITASGTGTLTLQTYGQPNIEITSRNGGAQVQNLRVVEMDSEGIASTGVYMENVNASVIDLFDIPGTVTAAHIVGRAVSYSTVTSSQAASMDFDGNSTTSAWYGTKGATVQRGLRGIWRDNVLGTQVLQLSSTPGAGGDLHNRANGFLYPNLPMGEHQYQRDSTVTLNASQAGDVIFAGSAAATFTLPTIIAVGAAPGNSHIGAWFDFINVGTGTLTIATDGTQTINKVAGRTSTTVAAGQSIKFIAANDLAGNLFWVVRQAATLLP